MTNFILHDQLHGQQESVKFTKYLFTVQFKLILPPAAFVSKHWQNNFVFLAALASSVTSQVGKHNFSKRNFTIRGCEFLDSQDKTLSFRKYFMSV